MITFLPWNWTLPCFAVQEKAGEPGSVSAGARLGSRLLQPHIADVLVHVERYMSRFLAEYTRKSSTPGRELNILSK